MLSEMTVREAKRIQQKAVDYRGNYKIGSAFDIYKYRLRRAVSGAGGKEHLTSNQSDDARYLDQLIDCYEEL